MHLPLEHSTIDTPQKHYTLQATCIIVWTISSCTSFEASLAATALISNQTNHNFNSCCTIKAFITPAYLSKGQKNDLHHSSNGEGVINIITNVKRNLFNQGRMFSKFVGTFHHEKKISIVVYGCTDSSIVVHKFISSYRSINLITAYFKSVQKLPKDLILRHFTILVFWV